MIKGEEGCVDHGSPFAKSLDARQQISSEIEFFNEGISNPIENQAGNKCNHQNGF